MRKNVMKLLMTALMIVVAVPFVNAQVKVGDILCEGDTIVSPSNYDSCGYAALGMFGERRNADPSLIVRFLPLAKS